MTETLNDRNVLGILVLLIPILLLFFRFLRSKKGVFAGSFTAGTDHKTETGRFSHVAADPEAMRSLRSLVRCLKDPAAYEKTGARMPRGILLYGPPGTGKTLMARALAGEAGVPFFSLCGSDFVEMYAGVGANRVRALFRKAHKAGKAVIFIDEIDSLGKKRGGEMSDERDQTLNALLSELSGIRKGEAILLIAATNRADMLDPALLRPGRLDRHIQVGLPDRDQRLAILRLHAANKPLAEDADLAALAADTVQFSGAALESLLNEAAIRAAEAGAGVIRSEDLQRAYRDAVAGADQEGGRYSPEERERVAVHEAGHALICRLRTPDKRILRVSILPTTRGAGGYNLAVGEERRLWTRERFLAEMDVLLAGRAAEEVLLGEAEISSGASDDLSRAAEMAAAMVSELALDGEKAVHLQTLSRCLHTSSREASDRCRRLLNQRYEKTLQLLQENRDGLYALKSLVLQRESIGGGEVDACLFPDPAAGVEG